MVKIAIIGAGFSGLGFCYHLLNKRENHEVTLFDPKGVGGGASGIASGLLHPYPGQSARLSWEGKKAMKAAVSLIDVASYALGERVAHEGGILRLALDEKQEKTFQEKAAEEDDLEWWEAEKCQERVKGAHFCPGIFIRSGLTVHPHLYLKGLWKACEHLGAHFEKKAAIVEDLTSFDQVIVAAGSGIQKLKECQDLGITYNKGQLLECQKPSYFNPGFSVIGKGYLALSKDQGKCYLGSTYEHEFLTEKPCLGTATEEIFSRVGKFLPSYGSFKPTQCLTGVRATNQKTYLPVVGRLKDNLWVLTAMGSRGLLYHSFMGEKLAAAISNNDEALIPERVRV